MEPEARGDAELPRLTLPRLAYWPIRWRDDYMERAAIMEYDGRMSRRDAEREAEKDVRRVAERE
jgi:hypothetical protein